MSILSVMYRDDRVALANEVGGLRHDLQRVEQENYAMRMAFQQRPTPMIGGKEFYASNGYYLQPGERAALSYHQLTDFPVWAVALLHLFTFGLFSLVHFGITHDKLPKAASDDPSAGKAIGFSFIPYFNLYWVFINTLRLTDRLNFQCALRGQPPAMPRGLVLATCIIGVIPYVNLLIGIPIMWTITSCYFQAAINKVVAMGPGIDVGALPPGQGYPQQGYPQQGYPQQGYPQQGYPPGPGGPGNPGQGWQ